MNSEFLDSELLDSDFWTPAKTPSQILLNDYEHENLLVLTQNSKLAKFFCIDISMGNKSFLFEVNPLFGQITEREKVFVRALAEKVFAIKNKSRIVVSLEVEEKFLTKKMLDQVSSALTTKSSEKSTTN